MKNRLLTGEVIDLVDCFENSITIWFNNKTNNFCFMLNAKVIKVAKTWKPIENKLNDFIEIVECRNSC